MDQTLEPRNSIVTKGRGDSSPRSTHAAANDKRVRPVMFAEFRASDRSNCRAGLVRGQAVIIIDADLQDPPEVILEMIEKWRSGAEVVYAVRGERVGETWFKKFTASLFYRIIFSITDVKIPLDTGDFRLMDRKVVNVMNTMREHHRFLRGMSAWVGFKQEGVVYKRAARFGGETKYPFRKMLKLALTAITGFSYFPLQLATYLGFVTAGIAILAIPIVAILRAMHRRRFLVRLRH